MFKHVTHIVLQGFIYANLTSCLDDKISTIGVVIFHGSNPIFGVQERNPLSQDQVQRLSTEPWLMLHMK